jgi:protein-disulfide isomerase
MKFNILLAFLALIGAYLAYNSANLYLIKRAASTVEDIYAFGPEDAELTIVEFLDYSCNKCQKTHPALKQAIEREGDVRFIPRPIFSETEGGNLAGKFVYAAANQGQFKQAHNRFIENYRPVNMAYIDESIAALGLDAQKIKADMDDPKIVRQMEKNKNYNRKLGSPTIPAFLINRRIFWVITRPIPTVQDFLNVFAETKAST